MVDSARRIVAECFFLGDSILKELLRLRLATVRGSLATITASGSLRLFASATLLWQILGQ